MLQVFMSKVVLLSCRNCPVHQSLKPSDANPDVEKKTRINTAGVTCHAWSAEGKGEGAAHESEVPLGIWLAETVFLFEKEAQDVVFLECTPRFPAQERLTEIFKDLAFVFAWHDGPELHGWPHRRRRVLAALVSKKTMDWLGTSDLAELAKDYSERFHQPAGSDGSVLLQAPLEDRVREMHQLARGRKNNVSLEEMGKIMENKDLFELARLVLPPGGVERLGQWEQEYMEKAKQDPDLKFYMCDVDHSVNTKGRQKCLILIALLLRLEPVLGFGALACHSIK